MDVDYLSATNAGSLADVRRALKDAPGVAEVEARTRI